ncbi:ribokinase [Nocardioides sp.]|uniref:ribokinase n=1 Tax=Nocardioides sp. TaxID=35761 RepID=UPI0039E5ADAC
MVLGSVNMDLVAEADHLPSPGETVPGTAFWTTPGGKGANQAIAAARVGGQVAMVGALGQDAFARDLRDHLRDNGVEIAGVRDEPGASGVALVTLDRAGENTIVTVAGANAALTSLQPADEQRIRDADMLIAQLEVPVQVVLQAARVAHEAGVPVLLNPSPVTQHIPPALWAYTTIVVVNQGEAAALGEVIEQVPHRVTTLGAAGIRYDGPDDAFALASPAVDAVDTTGAGDAFTGVLAATWSPSTPRHALERACAAGAIATTVKGASQSGLSASAVEELVTRTYGTHRPD